MINFPDILLVINFGFSILLLIRKTRPELFLVIERPLSVHIEITFANLFNIFKQIVSNNLHHLIGMTIKKYTLLII